MKYIKRILMIFCLLILSISNAQDLTQKQKEREEIKVKLFTMEEFSDLQLWFHNQVDKMKLTDDKENEYRSYINLYIGKMARLDDKDNDLTEDQMLKEMKLLIFKLNNKAKSFLTDGQNNIHLENIKVFENTVTNKLKPN